MKIERIGILGGTGFVGTSLCNRLAKEGYSLTVLTRNREYKRDNIILIPNLDLIETDIHDPRQLTRHLAGCDAVINLVGILNERGNKGRGFHQVHVALVEKLLDACRQNNIRRVLQLSALNADPRDGASHYLRSKGKAEDLLHQNQDEIKVTSFRPSVIFGYGDKFFNRFAGLLKFSPGAFPLACYGARFAPVHVLDVVEMITRSLNDPASYGKRFNLCGPEIYTLAELVTYIMAQTGRRRILLLLPDVLARLQALGFDLLGVLFYYAGMEKPFSMDNYHSAQQDSICATNDFRFYQITPTAVEAVVPAYLAGQTMRGRYHYFRGTRHSK